MALLEKHRVKRQRLDRLFEGQMGATNGPTPDLFLEQEKKLLNITLNRDYIKNPRALQETQKLAARANSPNS